MELTVELVSAACMLAALLAYVLLAGADFGAGIWDLLATGPRRQLQRDVLAHSVAPIWDTNHVWLILVVVILLTGFPSAFSAIMTALRVPVTIALLGIVARGSAFVFRSYSHGNASQQRWGSLFSIASVVTPIMLGVVLGTIASGALRWDGDTYISGFFAPWCAPFPWAVGAFAVAIFAFLAATYVCVELLGRSQIDPAVQEDFRRRALVAAAAVGVAAAVTWLLARSGAPAIERNLSGQWWKWPLQIATAAAAIGAIASLVRRRYVLARTCAVIQVTLIVGGFGAALFPFLVVPDFTIASSAAPPVTHRLLLAAIGLGALLLLPSLYVLFRVFKGRRAFAVIDEE
ncbi:MAG: cytochrome d ubiquinol oxidase subunit II [Phycisphaerae bacterium]|nr:cytochrome d ubiquinol oxidase subunit II [Phycisphaerae bacterium]